MDALLSAGASARAEDWAGATPAHLAWRRGHASLAAGLAERAAAECQTAAGEAGDGSAAALVLRAAEPWSPEAHELYPGAARAWAVAVVRLGTLLSRRFGGEEVSFLDAWRDYVMPHAVGRGSGSS